MPGSPAHVWEQSWKPVRPFQISAHRLPADAIAKWKVGTVGTVYSLTVHVCASCAREPFRSFHGSADIRWERSLIWLRGRTAPATEGTRSGPTEQSTSSSAPDDLARAGARRRAR